MRATKPLVERLMAKVDMRPDGCWLWTAAVNASGYGLINVGGRSKLAHRVAFDLHGGSIPPGKELDHLCRVRRCVNPEHLEPVTRLVNVQRGAGFGSETHCPAGHPYEGENLYVAPKGDRRCRACLAIRNSSRERKPACSCDDCREKHRERQRAYRQSKRERFLAGEVFQHGTRSTYSAGCRCPECRRAESEYTSQRRTDRSA